MKKEEEYTGNTKGGTWAGSPRGSDGLLKDSDYN